MATVLCIFGLLAMFATFGFFSGRPYSEEALAGAFALMGAVAGYAFGANDRDQ